MSPILYSLFLLFFFRLPYTYQMKIAKPGCPESCGNISIPYPFGIGSRCAIDRWAEVKCDTTFSPPKVYFTHSIPDEVVEFSVLRGEYNVESSVLVKRNISRVCSDGSGVITSSYDSSFDLNNTPFFWSNPRYSPSYFVVIGCGINGIFNGNIIDEYLDRIRNFTIQCKAICDGTEKTVGAGSCQFSLSDFQGIGSYSIQLETLNISGITQNRCGSAFVTDGWYYEPYIVGYSIVRLSFVVGNQTCEDAKKDPHFACKGNSRCVDYPGAGYNCECDVYIVSEYYHDGYYHGYEGNPYLEGGCQDINECDDPTWKPCSYKCVNTKGYYHCVNRPFVQWIVLGVVSILLLLGGGVWMYYKKKKQLRKLHEKLIQLDVRLLLVQEISSHATIYTTKRLQNATNNFHKSRILGEGGYGTIYKGILPDQSIVAVKKSKIMEKIQFEEFINEIAILTKIDHRNIVKLLGCSVDTEHPMLVYEFVSNGTLSDHIFKKSDRPYSSMSWENRLRIAAEIARAIAYLHSAMTIPIIHRDIKSSNILLDDNFTAKVADFGVSRVNHLDQTVISTLVKGTVGYLDPEYMQTSQLTEKSDVFSFGVVLTELLTGKRSISFERAQGERNLVVYFNTAIDEERLLNVVEEGMVNEENQKEVQAVALLVQKCLNFKGDERPSMKEVASELEALRSFNKKKPSSQNNNEGLTNPTSRHANLYPTSLINDGASSSTVAELTMSEIVAR